jgi:HlyD family secretion protein
MAQSLSPPQETAETAALPKLKRKFSPRLLIPLGLLLTGVGVSTWYFLSLPKPGEPLRVSGRIEGYETDAS